MSTLARSALIAALFATLVPAQVRTFQVPFQAGLPTLPSSGIPFAATPMRYQQIYEAADIRLSVNPVRIRGISFMCQQSGQIGGSVTMDLAIAHANPFPSNQFANNVRSDRLQILTQQVVQLPSPSVAGFTFTVLFPGQSEFTWNGVDDVLVDVRIIGNSNGNQAFNYFFETVTSAASAVQRLYAPGANATTATLNQIGTGLRTQFSYVDGLVLPYGAGCPGENNVVPVASVQGQPLIGTPGFTWLLTQARPQMPVVCIIGYSRLLWGTTPLPLDLASAGAPGCFLHTNVILLFPTASVGGPGAGTATVPFPLPAITAYRGIQLTSQWLVVDDSVNAAGFVMSRPVLVVIG